MKYCLKLLTYMFKSSICYNQWQSHNKAVHASNQVSYLVIVNVYIQIICNIECEHNSLLDSTWSIPLEQSARVTLISLIKLVQNVCYKKLTWHFPGLQNSVAPRRLHGGGKYEWSGEPDIQHIKEQSLKNLWFFEEPLTNKHIY